MENFPHPPTIVAVAAAVVLLVFILNRWLFTPLGEILEKRQAEIDGARQSFEAAQREQQKRLEEIETRLVVGRKEAFAIREQAQQEARAKREELLAEARQEAAAEIAAAKEQIAADVAKAHTELESQAEEIAAQIGERLLGRPVTSGGGG